jgi:acetyl esterase/lipase
VACVNACEGISTEDLEHYPSMPHGAVMLTAERDQLRSQNAELVEALRDLLERVDRNGGIGEYKGGPAFVTGKARALLARVKP